MHVNSFMAHSVTPMDFYRLGAGTDVSDMQVEGPLEACPREDWLPPPPPTPICTDAEHAIAKAMAEIEAKGAEYKAECVSMAEEVRKAIEADKDYKAKCTARAKEARQAVASAHLVGATPRKVAEETEEELAELEGSVEKTVTTTRPDLDMHIIGNEKPVLCWDTETAGLGKPGICQLAYVLVKTDGEVVCYDKVWKLPAGVFMSKDAQKIHGITTEKTRGGADPGAELLHFWNLAQQVLGEGGVVLGHNIQFDCRAFNFTASAWGLPNTLEHGHMLDTMRLSKQYSPLQTAKGYQKAFKNDELCKRSLPTNEHYVCVLICVRGHRRQASLGPLPRLGTAAQRAG